MSALAVAFFAASCGDGPVDSAQLDMELRETLQASSGGVGESYYELPSSTDYANIPQDPNNPITDEKVTLGKFLFHETGLGLDAKSAIGLRTYSCASCHHASAGFQSGLAQGIGEGGLGFGVAGEGRYKHPIYMNNLLDVQPIRTPTAMNVAYQECMLWSGALGATGINVGTEYAWTPETGKFNNFFGFQGVETQVLAGRRVHELDVSPEIFEELGYITMFDAAFPDYPVEERYDSITTALAIAAYERTILSNKAPFQLWLKGDNNAMTNEQKEGAILFFGKAGCASCHNGPNLANMEFHALGMEDLYGPTVFNTNPNDPVNRGRESFTSRPEDIYKFKVPTIYNLADQPFLGHGSSFTNIRDIVAYKNAAVKENINVDQKYISELFVPLGLSEEEIDKITVFIEEGLYDPELSRYEPLSLPSGNCFPNNDAVSRDELGCD